MDTDTPTTPIANPTLDATVLAIAALRDSTYAGNLPYITKIFERKEFPIAHARKILAMCMTEDLGGNKERIKFIRLVFGIEKTSDLEHAALSGLWHWLKPWQSDDGHWHANEEAGATMRKVIREAVDGVWQTASGEPTQAAFEI